MFSFLVVFSARSTSHTGPERFLGSFLGSGHRICFRYPKLVGGCRPIHLTELLEPEGWRILHHRSQVSFGICSEIMVAERLETV